MFILMNTGGVAATNSFLLADEVTGQAGLFDAPDHTVGPLLEEVARRGWTLSGLWLTHGHFDHFADHAVVTGRFPSAKVYIHAADAPKLQNPQLQTRMFGLPFTIPACHDYVSMGDGQKFQLGSIEGVALHTPGHSAGHVVYHFPKEEVLVGGDLIIGGSIGRTDLPDSNWEQMEASLKRVMALPGQTRLLGGHGDETTLEHERQHNPFVRSVLRPR